MFSRITVITTKQQLPSEGSAMIWTAWFVIVTVITSDVRNVFRSQKCWRNIFLRRLVRDHVGYQKRFQISKVSTKCFFEKAGSSFAMSQQLSLLAQRRTHSDSNVESFEKAQRLNPLVTQSLNHIMLQSIIRYLFKERDKREIFGSANDSSLSPIKMKGNRRLLCNSLWWEQLDVYLPICVSKRCSKRIFVLYAQWCLRMLKIWGTAENVSHVK